MMKRFGKFISPYLRYKRVRKRFGKFIKVKKVGSEDKD